MSEEKMRILKMIESNEITAAEGLKLMDEIDEKERHHEKTKSVNNGFSINYSDDFKEEMKSLGKNIKKEMKSLQKEAENIGKDIKNNIDVSYIKDVVSDAVDSINPMEFNSESKFDEDKEVSNYNIAQEFTLNCDAKKEILINVISTDINIITEERDEILVKYISYSEKDENTFKIVVEEDSKRIRLSERKGKGQNSFLNFNISSGGRELLIRLPRKYKESISIKTVSGDLNINYLDSDSFRFSSVSGDINADIIYSVNSLVKTTSGDCDIDLFRGSMMFSSVSGDINVKYEQLDGDLTMKSVSGDAEISLPKNSEFEMIGKTVSGDLSCEFPLVVIGSVKRGRLRGQVGSDDYTISAATTSGDVNISRY